MRVKIHWNRLMNFYPDNYHHIFKFQLFKNNKCKRILALLLKYFFKFQINACKCLHSPIFIYNVEKSIYDELYNSLKKLYFVIYTVFYT